MPKLRAFWISNLDGMKKESMTKLKEVLVLHKNLEILGLNELPFDIKEFKEDIIEILKANVETLRYLSLNRNDLTT